MTASGFGAPGSLAVEELMKLAREQAGLQDFGDPWFEVPLRSLVDLINDEARLVSTDIDMVRKIVSYLVDRLRLVAFLDEHPAARDERVDVAGVIIGLARGGSTLAQRLLGSSPQLTSIHKYEVVAPLPLPGAAIGDTAPRIAHCQQVLDEMAARWPELASMHPMTPAAYEEEIELVDRSFASIMYPFYFHLPSYSRWLFDYDDARMYEELIVWLKVLQYQGEPREGKRWLLKSPQHLMSGSLRNCMEAFPDAHVLMTHRNLRSVVGSSVSMQHAMLKDITHDLDPREVGTSSMELQRMALERLIELREASPSERFIDLQYSDLVQDPIGQFEHALGQMGFTVTADDLKAAEAWMASHQRDTHPPHHYRIEDYVDLDLFDRTFEFYHSRFLAPAA